jgi:hypothetical protein
VEYTDITQLIGQYGFPIFVAMWYMFKQSQDTKAMTEALGKLTTVITILVERESVK